MDTANKKIFAQNVVKFDVVEELKSINFSITEAEVSTAGNYLVEDAVWNYLDTQHTDVIHPAVVKHSPFFVQDRVLATILTIKRYGILTPILLFQYIDEDSSFHTVQGLSFGIILKSIIRFSQETENKTRVTVNYYICSHKFLKVLHPLIVRMLKKNFKNLMDEDTPMRERKMKLRKLGFKNVGGSSQSFLKTLNIYKNNIIYHPDESPESPINNQKKEHTINVQDLRTRNRIIVDLSPDKSFLCVSESNRISIFKSYCLHEGADLKFAAIKNNKLICPWHNRKVPPVAQFDWNHPQKVELKDEQVCLIFEDEKILFKNLAQIPH